MRKAAPDATFIFVCRVDSRTRIAAIANLLLNAPVGLTTFVGADRHSSCGSLVASRGNVAPFDSDAALGVDSSSRVGWPCAVDLTGLPCPGGFGAMYAAHVHRRCVSSGVFYAPCNPVLLATWCGTRGAVMDWPLLRRKWGSGCPPAALSRVVCEITGAKAERLWLRDAETQLWWARGLPRVAGCVCHVPHCCPTGVVKSALSSFLETAKTKTAEPAGTLMGLVAHAFCCICRAQVPGAVGCSSCVQRLVLQQCCNDVHADFCLDAVAGLLRVEQVLRLACVNVAPN